MCFMLKTLQKKIVFIEFWNHAYLKNNNLIKLKKDKKLKSYNLL